MIRKLFVLVALAAAFRLSGLLPFQSSDVAELVPVQALVISVEDGEIRLDGGDCLGVGADWDSAWEDLQKSASGHVFLGTVDHVIVCGEGLSLLPKVVESRAFRSAVSVCSASEIVPNAKLAANYLSAHGGSVTLRQLRALRLHPGEVRLPQLAETEGGLRLYG